MSTKQSKHKAHERQMLQAATQALNGLPEEEREVAEAARTQLYNWLVTMDRATKDPGELASDDLANTGCDVLEAAVAAQVEGEDSKGGKWTKLQKAFQALEDEDQLNLMRMVLMGTFRKHAKSAALMSKATDLFLWENTGFHVDGDLKTAFAKVGRKNFQPIGFDDGKRYVGTEGAKTLWIREFSMALMFPYPSPFVVERQELEPQHVSDHVQVSDKEREKIHAALGELEKDLDTYGRILDKGEKKEFEEKMREQLKLQRIRLPRLDHKLDEIQEEHPDVGSNFEHIEMGQLFASCCEFLRMRLDDDDVRRRMEETVLSVGATPAEERVRLYTTLLDGIAVLIPPEGVSVPDGDALAQRISEAAISIPEIRELLDELREDTDVLEAAKATMLWLQKHLDSARGEAASAETSMMEAQQSPDEATELLEEGDGE